MKTLLTTACILALAGCDGFQPETRISASAAAALDGVNPRAPGTDYTDEKGCVHHVAKIGDKPGQQEFFDPAEDCPVVTAQKMGDPGAAWIVPALGLVAVVVATKDDHPGQTCTEACEPPPPCQDDCGGFTSKEARFHELGYDGWWEYPDRQAVLDYFGEVGADGDWSGFGVGG